MKLTTEQQEVVDTAKLPHVTLVKVQACAGAGKTATLIELSKQLEPKSGMYLAYNKAIATEAAGKFAGTPIECRTIHSLAYGSTVRQYGLKVGFFKGRHITERLDPQSKAEVVDAIEEFMLSANTDFEAYIRTTDLSPRLRALASLYVNKMAQGLIECNHSFYLKYYHILLSNHTLQPPKTDLLMLDEFGDITALTIEIFKLIQAKKKIAVGDVMQNIYSFTKTINGFKALEGQGETVKLTRSFRCSEDVAFRIESFCREFLDDKFEFKGRPEVVLPANPTIALISRTNGGIIKSMMTLGSMGIPYNLTRPASEIFGLVITLLNLKQNPDIRRADMKFLISDMRKYYAAPNLQRAYPTPLKYVMAVHSSDPQIKSGINVILELGPQMIYSLYNEAKAHEKVKVKHQYTITTSHSSKGLEYDMVEIQPDLDLSASKAIEDLKTCDITEEDRLQEELRLYYVAASRAMYKVTGKLLEHYQGNSCQN